MKKILAGLALLLSVGSAQAVLSTQTFNFANTNGTGVFNTTTGFNSTGPLSFAAANFRSFTAGTDTYIDYYKFHTILSTNSGLENSQFNSGWRTIALNVQVPAVTVDTYELYLGSTIGLGTLILSGTTGLGTNLGSQGIASIADNTDYYLKVAGKVLQPVDFGSSYLLGVSITAVPEPSEWALMLSGLGLMGFVARRRRAAATAAA